MKIELLMEKYFEGVTTPDEESAIKEYFSGGEISPDLIKYKPMFDYYQNEHKVTLSDSFDDKLSELLLQNEQPKVYKLNRKYYYISAAACILVLIIIGFYWSSKPGQVINTNVASRSIEQPRQVDINKSGQNGFVTKNDVIADNKPKSAVKHKKIVKAKKDPLEHLDSVFKFLDEKLAKADEKVENLKLLGNTVEILNNYDKTNNHE